MQNLTANAPLLISKAELRRELRCTSDYQWKTKYFPDTVIKELFGMDREGFNRIRQFDAIQTQRIINFFRLYETN